MAAIQGNRLLPLIALGVLGIVVFVVLRGSDTRTPPPSLATTTETLPANVETVAPASVLPEVPLAPQPDADSPAEAVKTLSAQVTDMTQTMKAWAKESEILRNMRERLRTELTESVSGDVLGEQQQALSAARDQDRRALHGIMARIEDLSGQVTLLEQGSQRERDAQQGSDLPIGLGFDRHGLPDLSRDSAMTVAPTYIWIEPLGSASEHSAQQGVQRASTPGRRLLTPTRTAVAQEFEGINTRAQNVAEPQAVKPVYTVPENATLLGTTAFSALIGRIPVKGVVSDPFPFKVIVGADNLAANGLKVPGVEGMIFRGVATGDLNLRCVRGELISVTFVFQDGTIRTQRADTKQRLGTISDRQGIGCVSGELISNAPAYLATIIGLGVAETGAQAAAGSETTSVVTATGATANSVTGDTARFVLGNAMAGGVSEAKQWLMDRMGQSFDAIFVQPGIELALDIETALTIDYDPNGRRTRYETSPVAHRQRRLD